MAITSQFTAGTGQLDITGDALDNTAIASRDVAGAILVNDGAIATSGGTPTVANTSLIQIIGQDGNDTLTLDETNGALPRANLFGNAGNDTATGGSGNDQISGGEGNDTMFGKGGTDSLFGGSGDDILTGGDGDDQVFGEDGNDRMIWNPGEDSDLNEGGAGNDTVEVNGGNGAETFTAAANGTRVRFDRVNPAPFSLDIGTTENLVVNGNGGDDVFNAGNGLGPLIKITVDGGAGNDTLGGGDGDDVLIGGDGNDFVDGNRGNDTAFLGAGNDVFQWDPGDGNDVIEGQAGLDTMLFNGANVNENIDFSANGERLRFFRDVASVTMDTNDVEQVDFNALGGADNIVINDLSGTDVKQINLNLAGTSGGDGQPDTIKANGTNGKDTVTVTGSADAATVAGLAAQVAIAGAETTNDSLLINGLGGNDAIDARTMAADAIQVIIDGGTGTDTLNGGAGNDTLVGGGGSDLLFGRGGNDTVLGGKGKDALNGGTGSDILFGGNGNDTLKGGKGSDIFVLALGTGVDVIKDYKDGVDKLGLANDLSAGQLQFVQQGSSTVIQSGGQNLAIMNGVNVNQLTANDFVNIGFSTVNGVSVPTVVV